MINRRKRRMSLAVKILLVVVVTLAFFGLYKYQQYNYFISTPADPNNQEETILTIEKGENLKTIASTLSQQGMILDQESFNIYGRFGGLDKSIKIGRFPLSPSLTTPEIYEIITSNDLRQVVVTIPEGSTIEDIDRILVDQSLIATNEFAEKAKTFQNWGKYDFLDTNRLSSLPHPLEGYLFPDTYFVSANEFSSEEFISMLLNTFETKALPVLKNSENTITDTVIVASMVEKEANRDQDRPIIAGIIWKRLNEKWVLGIDATLLYLKNDREISFQDLQEDTPYNTRKVAGLPPGPICNPGLASLTAAAKPQETPYYFYLTTGEGDMVYAVTNEEHNRNKSLL